MAAISVTELVSQSPMGWLKAEAPYRIVRDKWTRGVSACVEETTTNDYETIDILFHRGTRTSNMPSMSVTELVSQSPIGWLNVTASYSIGGDKWTRGVSIKTIEGKGSRGAKHH